MTIQLCVVKWQKAECTCFILISTKWDFTKYLGILYSLLNIFWRLLLRKMWLDIILTDLWPLMYTFYAHSVFSIESLRIFNSLSLALHLAMPVHFSIFSANQGYFLYFFSFGIFPLCSLFCHLKFALQHMFLSSLWKRRSLKTSLYIYKMWGY